MSIDSDPSTQPLSERVNPWDGLSPDEIIARTTFIATVTRPRTELQSRVDMVQQHLPAPVEETVGAIALSSEQEYTD